MKQPEVVSRLQGKEQTSLDIAKKTINNAKSYAKDTVQVVTTFLNSDATAGNDAGEGGLGPQDLTNRFENSKTTADQLFSPVWFKKLEDSRAEDPALARLATEKTETAVLNAIAVTTSQAMRDAEVSAMLKVDPKTGKVSAKADEEKSRRQAIEGASTLYKNLIGLGNVDFGVPTSDQPWTDVFTGLFNRVGNVPIAKEHAQALERYTGMLSQLEGKDGSSGKATDKVDFIFKEVANSMNGVTEASFSGKETIGGASVPLAQMLPGDDITSAPTEDAPGNTISDGPIRDGVPASKEAPGNTISDGPLDKGDAIRINPERLLELMQELKKEGYYKDKSPEDVAQAEKLLKELQSA